MRSADPISCLGRPDRRVAIEFERTAKGRSRVERIASYRVAAWFDEVRFFAGDAQVAKVLARVLAATPGDRLTAARWPGLPAERRALVRAALA